MKRLTFIKFFITAGTIIISPLIVVAKRLNTKRVDKGIKVEAGKDRFDKPQLLFDGDTFYTKVSTQDTDGDLYIFESFRDKLGGPPLHYHYDQDEWWYILEGEFLFKIGEMTFSVKKGDSVFGPRMIPHAFAKTNDGPARMLLGFQPAGKMEAHFRAVSEGVYGKLSETEKHKFRQSNGFEVVGPALTFDKSKS